MKKLGLYLSVLVLAVLFFVFGLFNKAQVQFDYILGSTQLPLVFVMLICFVCGALLTQIVFGLKFLYWKNRAVALEKMLAHEYKAQDKAQVRAEFEQSHQA